MALPKEDNRVRLEPFTDAMVAAAAASEGKSKQEVMREVLDAWAKQRAVFLIEAQRALPDYDLMREAREFAGRFAAKRVLEAGDDD